MKDVSRLAVPLCMAVAASARAAGPARSREQTPSTQQMQTQERIDGYELMSPQECIEYRNRNDEDRTGARTGPGMRGPGSAAWGGYRR